MNENIISYGKLTDLSMRTWMQIVRAHYKIHEKEIKYFQEHNLTFNQFKVLEVLYHRGDLSIGSITKITMSTPGNTTVVVRNLKRDGWITTILDEKDKRISILTLTQKGRDVIENIFPTHAKNLTEQMGVLSEDELETLYTLLNKLQKAQ